MRALLESEIHHVSGGVIDVWAKSVWGGSITDWNGSAQYDFADICVTGHLNTSQMSTGMLAAWVGLGIALTVVTGGAGAFAVGALVGGAEVATTAGALLGAAAAAAAALAAAGGAVAGATDAGPKVSPGCQIQ